MEVFSLLKFWRNAGATDSSVGDTFSEADFSTCSSYDFRNQMEEEEEEEYDDDDSFFDLVFTSPDRDTKQSKCTTTPVKINDRKSKLDGDIMSNFMESPTDVFYKSNSLPKQSNSKPQSPISVLRSSPKLRVFMLGFSKPKVVKSQVSCASMAATSPNQLGSSKRFTVDCQIEEVTMAPFLTRDNSLRAKLRTEGFDDNSSNEAPSKRFPKDVANKYLNNLIKPLYVKSSKRNTDKTRFSEQSPTVTPSTSPATAPALSPMKQVGEKQGSRSTVFRKVSKHLGKSRSDSRLMAGKGNLSPSSRSDDSAAQQQDGIQGAILHCKRSFNSRCSVLSRSESAPAHAHVSMNLQPRNSVEEEKRSSI